jgi:hypothetical protein
MNSFQIMFWDLSSLYRSILKQLIRLHKKWNGNVYVLRVSLSIWCRCSLSTVKRALSEFKRKGWIGSMERKRQCNRYFLNEEVVKNLEVITKARKSNFHSGNEPSMNPIYTTNRISERSNTKECVNVCGQKTKFKKRGPQEYGDSERKELQNTFSEWIYAKAVEKYRWWRNQGNKPENIYAVMRGLCNKIKSGVIK